MTPIPSSTPGSAWFLSGVENIQQRLTQTVQQLTSGYQVSDAADAPGLAPQIVNLGSALATVQAYQSNLNGAQTESAAADSALGAAVNLLQNAQTLAVQGADSTATASARQTLALQVQSLQQQLVSIANTSVAGQYIFGGANAQSAPYQYDPAGANGVDALTTPSAGPLLVDPNGLPVYQGLTAQQIFDARDLSGNPLAGNAFAALQGLRNALNANDQAGVATELGNVQAAAGYLNQQQSYYGAAEQRIGSEQNTAASRVTELQTAIGNIRDTNVTQAATDLSQETIDQSAAYGAESLISKKTLFDYIG